VIVHERDQFDRRAREGVSTPDLVWLSPLVRTRVRRKMTFWRWSGSAHASGHWAR